MIGFQKSILLPCCVFGRYPQKKKQQRKEARLEERDAEKRGVVPLFFLFSLLRFWFQEKRNGMGSKGLVRISWGIGSWYLTKGKMTAFSAVLFPQV